MSDYTTDQIDHVAAEKSNSIVYSIQELGLPTNLSGSAQLVAETLNQGITKGKKRQKLILYCVYAGYAFLMKEGVWINIYDIFHKLGTDMKTMNSAHSIYCSVQTGFEVPTVNVDIILLIHDILDRIDYPLDPSIDDFARNYIKYHPHMLDNDPGKLSVFIINKFMESIGFSGFLNDITMIQQKCHIDLKGIRAMTE